jgi:hypothetical protein
MAGKLHIESPGLAGAARPGEEKAHGNEESEEAQPASWEEIGQEASFDRDHIGGIVSADAVRGQMSKDAKSLWRDAARAARRGEWHDTSDSFWSKLIRLSGRSQREGKLNGNEESEENQ